MDVFFGAADFRLAPFTSIYCVKIIRAAFRRGDVGLKEKLNRNPIENADLRLKR